PVAGLAIAGVARGLLPGPSGLPTWVWLELPAAFMGLYLAASIFYMRSGDLPMSTFLLTCAIAALGEVSSLLHTSGVAVNLLGWGAPGRCAGRPLARGRAGPVVVRCAQYGMLPQPLRPPVQSAITKLGPPTGASGCGSVGSDCTVRLST